MGEGSREVAPRGLLVGRRVWVEGALDTPGEEVDDVDAHLEDGIDAMFERLSDKFPSLTFHQEAT